MASRRGGWGTMHDKLSLTLDTVNSTTAMDTVNSTKAMDTANSTTAMDTVNSTTAIASGCVEPAAYPFCNVHCKHSTRLKHHYHKSCNKYIHK
jgi:hypothetical protein